jgi:hypothetical protein
MPEVLELSDGLGAADAINDTVDVDVTPEPEVVAEPEPTPEPVAEPSLEGDEPEPAPAEEDDGVSLLEDEEQSAEVTDPNKPPVPADAPEDIALKDLYRMHPEWKDVFRQHPQLRKEFFRTAEIVKEFPTVAEARVAKEQAIEFNKFEEMYYSGTNEGIEGFVQELARNDLDPTTGKSLGAYAKFQEVVTNNVFNSLDQLLINHPVDMAKYANVSPETAKAALQIVGKMLGVRMRNEQGAGQLPAAGQPQPGAAGQHPLEAQLNARQRQLDERERTYVENHTKAFNEGVTSSYDNWLAGDIARRLGPAQAALDKLPPLVRNSIQSAITQKVNTALQNDKFFTSQLNVTLRSGQRDKAHADKVLDALQTKTRVFLNDAIRSTLEEAGLRIKQQQKQQAARQAAGAARREPVAQPGPGRVQAPSSKTPSGSATRQPAVKESYEKWANRQLGVS